MRISDAFRHGLKFTLFFDHGDSSSADHEDAID